jgi:GNAT superfamily N-acetyltransferase
MVDRAAAGLDDLFEFALRPWGAARPGLVQHRTPERLVELRPSFPIPGPNHVCLVRAREDRVEAMIDETRLLVASYRLGSAWLLDPAVEPPGLAERLEARGIAFSEELHVMVLPAGAEVAAPPDVELQDALASSSLFAAAEAVQDEAFGATAAVPGRVRRLAEARADASRHFLLALVDGTPAGAGWATVGEGGVLLNGGAVRPAFRGRGVYRALVAERLRLAQRVGAPGLATQARPATAGPILARLGFQQVGSWRLHLDPLTGRGTAAVRAAQEARAGGASIAAPSSRLRAE